jgi:hypothetical protein
MHEMEMNWKIGQKKKKRLKYQFSQLEVDLDFQ